jgi:HEAT repeat protein
MPVKPEIPGRPVVRPGQVWKGTFTYAGETQRATLVILSASERSFEAAWTGTMKLTLKATVKPGARGGSEVGMRFYDGEGIYSAGSGTIQGKTLNGTYAVVSGKDAGKGGKINLARSSEPKPAPLPVPKPSKVVQALIEQLTDKDALMRRTAAETLGKLGAKEAVPALIKRVADDVWLQAPDSIFRDPTPYDGCSDRRGSKDRALQVLRKLAPDKVEEALLAATKSKTPAVRWWAALELAGQKKSQAIVKALVTGLGDRDAYVRLAAADTLGKLRAKEAVPALIKRVADDVWLQAPDSIFRDPTPYDGCSDRRGSKDRALQVLRKLAPDKVEEALAAAMKSKKPEVRRWAVAAAAE